MLLSNFTRMSRFTGKYRQIYGIIEVLPPIVVLTIRLEGRLHRPQRNGEKVYTFQLLEHDTQHGIN
jgi:hypothetical protein